MYHVFLSYNRQDADQVELLTTRLTHEAALRVWLDRDRLPAGFSWREEIEAAMNACRATLIVWGPHGLGPVQRQERDLAYAIRDARSDFRVLYCFLPGATLPQGSWTNVDTWIHFKSSLDEPDAFAQLVATLKGEAPPIALHAILPNDPAPYQGLADFGVEDSAFFFGRTTYVEEMVERLPRHPFLAVLGPSGSGKTSLVQAGFLAHLQAHPRFRGAARPWLLLRPGATPLQAVAVALTRLQPQQDSITLSDHLYERLQAAPHSLPVLLQTLLPSQQPLVLVVDRLEELFTLCESETERRACIEALLAVVHHPHQPVWVIATMRADFYGHVGRYADLAEQIVNHQLYLKGMKAEELSEVVEAPATLVGAIFEKGLAMQVRADAQARGEVALPLLAHTLDLLWRKRQGRWLTWDAYREVGGVTGALRYHADRVIEELSLEERAVACRLFLRMIWVDESAGTIAARRIEKSVLIEQAANPKMNERVLRRLTDERLVIVREVGTQAMVEVVHDTLPLHWRRLHDWLQEDRDFVLWQQRLSSAIAEWEITSREKGALLRGVRLAEAERWLAVRPEDISTTATAFLQASQNEEQQERARTQAEAERYRQLFEEAERQRRTAVARQLVAQAELMRNHQAELLQSSVLLAVEAMRLSPSLEADQTLRRGLALLPRPVIRMVHDSSVQALALSPDGRYLATATQNHAVHVWEVQNGEEIVRVEHAHVVTAVNSDAGISFSPDGRYFATANGDDTARVWETTTGRELFHLPHPQLVYAVTFSPAGCHLATVSRDCTVRVWEVATGLQIAQLTHKDEVRAVTFSPDGTYLATASLEGLACVWDPTNGRAIFRLQHEDGVRHVTFSPDGRYVASASQDHTARVWEVRSGQEIARMMHDDLVWSVAFSPDSRYVATASQDHTARIWETRNGREITRLPHEREVRSIAFSPDGTRIVTTSHAVARVWQVMDGKEVCRMFHEDFVWAVAFNPDGAYLVSASSDHTARVWEPRGYQETVRITHPDHVNAIAFSPDGVHVASTSSNTWLSQDHTVHLWKIPSGREVAHMQHAGKVFATVFSPDGRYLATVSGDSTAKVWNVTDGQLVTTLLHADLVWAVAFNHDSTLLTTACMDGTARVWEAHTGREVTHFVHERNVVAVAFSPDGRYVATASGDATAGVWAVASGQPVVRLRHDDVVWGVAFSPDGTLVATASMDGAARIWEIHTGCEVARLVHERNVLAVAFSPDGRYVATASTDHTARLWDVSHGREVARVRHEGGVRSVVFSFDGQYVVTASADHTARIWQPLTGREISRLTHEGAVSMAAFSPNGRYVVSASDDHSMRVWLWLPEDLVTEACARLTRDLTPEEWRQYMGEEPYRKTRVIGALRSQNV